MASSPSATGDTRPIYAGFWLRFVAYLLDTVILGCPLFILNFIVVILLRMASTGPANYRSAASALFLAWFLFFVNSMWLYFALMESSAWQATFGKKILGLKVTDLDGRRLSFGRATGRTLAKFFSTMTFGVGYILCGFTKKKQAVHDLIAKCLVLRQPQSI